MTGGLIAWAGICMTYLRFRAAYQAQGLKKEIVPESISPFQPLLAWYGLIWSIFVSIFPSVQADHGGVFQGFLIFTRHNPYWSTVSTSWGFTIGPYVLTGSFFVLFLAWMIKTRIRQGYWTWKLKAPEKLDITTGVAPKDLSQPPTWGPWLTIFKRFLETL